MSSSPMLHTLRQKFSISRSRPRRPSLMFSCTGMLSTTAKRSPAAGRERRGPRVVRPGAQAGPRGPEDPPPWEREALRLEARRELLGERPRALGAGGRGVVGREAEHRAHSRRIADQHARPPRQRLEERPRGAVAPQRLAGGQVEAHRPAPGAYLRDAARPGRDPAL